MHRKITKLTFSPMNNSTVKAVHYIISALLLRTWDFENWTLSNTLQTKNKALLTPSVGLVRKYLVCKGSPESSKSHILKNKFRAFFMTLTNNLFTTMKTKNILFGASLMIAALTLSSCGTMYNYIQILSTKPVNNLSNTSIVNGGILYEDDYCAIFYKFWDNGGDAGFEFYNKTNQIIYLDLSKTFFVKNGIAYDYYKDKTITDTKTTNASSSNTYGYGLSSTRSYSASISQYYAGNFGYLPTTTFSPIASSANLGASKSYGALLFGSATATTTLGHSTSVSISTNPILAIPPKSSKFINNFSIMSNEFVNCDLKYYPDGSDKITFDQENTPLTFSNYITFKVGDSSQLQSVENKFYVHEIANYVEQDVTDYVERDKTCENILTPNEIKSQQYEPKIYDAYITVGNESSFYMTYKVLSSSKLYKRQHPGLYWSNTYNGYTKGESQSMFFVPTQSKE